MNTPKFAQAPNAPDWKQKPGKGGVFAVAILLAGLAAALLPSEARVTHVYKDSANIDTVCMGLTGPVTKRHPGVEWTVDECKVAEAEYLAPMLRGMAACIPEAVRREMTYGEWISYGHWNYNTGAICRSTAGKKLAAGDHVGACRSMGNWTFIHYKGRSRNCRDPDMRRVCGGLVTRRDLEVSSCLEALP